MKNKEIKTKLSYLWFNLVMCLTTLMGVYVTLSIFGKISNAIAIIIAVWFYIFDVVNNSKNDYNDSKIKRLENDIEKLKAEK